MLAMKAKQRKRGLVILATAWLVSGFVVSPCRTFCSQKSGQRHGLGRLAAPNKDLTKGRTEAATDEVDALTTARRQLQLALGQQASAQKQVDIAQNQVDMAQNQVDMAQKQVDMAQKQVDMALEDLRKAKQKGDEQKVEKAKKELEKAEEKVEKAEEKVEKAEEKVEKAKKELEKAKKELEKAEEKVEKAEEKVEKAEEKVKEAQKEVKAQQEKVQGLEEVKEESLPLLKKFAGDLGDLDERILNSRINNIEERPFLERDDVIQSIMEEMEKTQRLKINKPRVVALWSPRGTGKTSVIRRLAKMDEYAESRRCGAGGQIQTHGFQ
eukprot:s350_g9.t1